MFRHYCIHNIFDYICAQNAQCWARITKSDMEIQRYNRLKIVLAEKERNRYLALRADGTQHQYRFTMDDQQGAAISGTVLRDCSSPRRGCEGIVSVVKVNIEYLSQ